MRKLLLLIVLVAAAAALGRGGDAWAASAPAPYAGQCGLPSSQPIWADFGWPTDQFDPIFGKAGIVLGASSGAYPARMRAAGAATVYFDLNFNKRIGTTTKPADPATIQAKAQGLFTFAVTQTGCPTPVIVLNELAGASLVTPWSDNNARYRQNALTFVQALAGLGAHPVLLLAAKPYTGGDAAVWWQQAAAAAELVREVYVPATATWKNGPVLGNRNLRSSYRNAISDFTALGIPPNRLGLMISFATTKGFGGRNGLSPAESWYEVAKWEALAAKQVAAETGIASVWSWGWGEWTAPEQDPAKPYALCAWLWARSPALCNAPQAIPGFDTSLTDGQLSVLGPATQCLVGKRPLTNAAIDQLQAVTGDRETAYSALFARLVESAQAPVATSAVLAAERGVILQSFGGSRAAYLAALARAHADVEVARAIISDQLRRAEIGARLTAPAPSAGEVQTFYDSYPDLPVRFVQTTPAASWLGSLKQGFALADVAPDRIFALATGKKTKVRTSDGSYDVKLLDDAVPLGAVPFSRARPAIAAALRQFARGLAYEKWTVARQNGALDTATCAKDDLPQPASIDLTQYIPFLRL